MSRRSRTLGSIALAVAALLVITRFVVFEDGREGSDPVTPDGARSEVDASRRIEGGALAAPRAPSERIAADASDGEPERADAAEQDRDPFETQADRETGSVVLRMAMLAGSTESSFVDSGAIDLAPGPEMVGSMVSETGRPITGVTVVLAREEEDDRPPAGGRGITVRDDDGARTSGWSTTSEGLRTHVDLEAGRDGIDPIRGDERYEVFVDVGAVYGGLVFVRFTPTVGTGARRADLLAGATISGDERSASSSIEDPYHARATLRVENVDEEGRAATRVEGAIPTNLGKTAALAAAHLELPGSAERVPGGVAGTDGNRFQFAAFEPLAPGAAYDLVLVFEDQPTGPYEVQLRAEF